MKSELSLDQSRGDESGDAAELRVAFFSDALPERNGTGAYYHDLLVHLGGRVADLAMFQPALHKRSRVSIAMPGDRGQRLEAPHLRAIRRRCSELKPDVVVVVTPGLYGLLGAWEARRHGATLIAAFHTDFEQLARMYWNPFARFFANLILRTANRIICSASRSVLINNVGLEDDVRHLGAKRVDLIGTPLAPEFLRRPCTTIAPRMERVCFAGRLAPEKNVEHIIDAARELPQLEFVIGGDGPLADTLRARARGLGNVRFAGWLDRGSLIDLIDGASVLLLPSAFETFGSVALEAMARGRPAVVSVTAGIHAWPELRDGLISLEDPRDLKATLEQLLGMGPEDWGARSAAARHAAEALNQRTVDHWLQLLLRYRGPLLPPSPAEPNP